MGSILSAGATQQETQDLDRVPNVTNVQDLQSLRIRKPALLWVYMKECHWSKVSAKPVSDFGARSPVPVYGIDGPKYRNNLAQVGLRPRGYPTIYFLKDNKRATEMTTQATVSSIESFVRNELR